MLVREESARLQVPKNSLSDPFHSKVFYNPRMRFNRSLSSLAAGASGAKTACDGLCASGARGIRYFLENGLDSVDFVDANPDAAGAARENVEFNSVNGEVLEGGFNERLEKKYDWVELDPFGSPAPFLEAAFKHAKKFVSITATDLANLCSAHKERQAVCRRVYGAEPLHCPFSHELALRILVAKCVRVAEECGMTARPVLSFYEGHATKTVLRLGVGGGSRKECFVSFDGAEARVAGEGAGPLWAGDLCDSSFLQKCIEINCRGYADEKRIAKALELLEGECGLPPYYYDLHALSDFFGVETPSKKKVLEALRSPGYRAVETHFAPTGIKTNAPFKELAQMFTSSSSAFLSSR
jgi:tRNA (guanine26-N2/guanine27-N2)-dimethyltransferase